MFGEAVQRAVLPVALTNQLYLVGAAAVLFKRKSFCSAPSIYL